MADFGEAITSKHVPYVFDSRRIKAHELAEKSESQLARKKWKYAEKLAHQALRLAPDSAAAMVAAGRCNLRIRRTDKAREYFSQALSISPRIHVQKELQWLNLEEGHLPVAISLLSDHLDRNASDLEAYNLLIKCFFLSGRYEAGEDLARVLMNEKTGNDCFRNNRFICRLLNGGYSEQDLNQIDISEVVNPFIAHNLSVAREKPSSWEVNGTPSLPEKLVLQEYEFGIAHRAGKTNSISIRLQDGSLQEISAPIITIGALDTNTIALPDRSVSRRHALIVNFPNEVWLYDLGSKFGTYLNEYRVSGRIFLDGVHRLTMGQSTVEVAASADLLV
jgi:Tfp pilus assembly protein PilF